VQVVFVGGSLSQWGVEVWLAVITDPLCHMCSPDVGMRSRSPTGHPTSPWCRSQICLPSSHQSFHL